MDSEVTVENSSLIGGISVSTGYEDTASVIATNNVTLTSIEGSSAAGVGVSSGGVATFSFDPTSLFSLYNKGTVVDNGNGTWTVNGVGGFTIIQIITTGCLCLCAGSFL